LLALAASAAAAQDSLTATPVLADGAPVYSAQLLCSTTVTPAVAGSSVRFTNTVTFKLDGVPLGKAPVDATGVSTMSIVFTTVGIHSVRASYDGDSNYNTSSSGDLMVTVVKADTSVTMAANPPQANQMVAIRAAPAVVSPASVATGGKVAGSVDFLNGTTAIAGCTGVALQSGVAICNTSFSQLGSYVINTKYNGDANTNPSTGTLSLTIGKALAGMYLAFAPDAPTYGSPVMLNALLTPAAGVAAPTGTVAFSEGAVPLGSSTVGSDSRASVVVPTLTAGVHTITAAYSGDASYQPSVSAPLALTVAKAPTSLAVTASAAQVNQTVVLKATVTPPSAGTVTMTNGNASICTDVPVDKGVATCNYKFPALGDYAISAAYTGDANTANSTASVKITVGKVSAGIYTAFTPTSPVAGGALTVNALLLGADGVHTPTGSVAFSEGSTTLGTIPVDNDGRASLGLASGLPAGTHNLVAAYSGDGNYVPVSAAPLAIAVGKAATAIALASNPPQLSQPLNLKAAVTVVAPGNAAPGGTVDFTNGGKPIAGCTGVALQSGVAYCNTSLSQLGDYTVAAAYSGDASTAPCSGTLQLGVGKAAPSIYMAFAPNSPVYGAMVTVNALVLGATGMAAPSGTVTFSEGGVARGTFALGSDGRASLVSVALSVGAHSFSAVYNGDTNYATATADPLAVTVGKASTSTVVSAASGAPLSATVSVTPPGAGIPTGSVQFYQAGALIGSAALQQVGSQFTATLASANPAGNLWAVYQGDANFAGSASQTANVNATAQVSLASDHNPVTAGQAVTLTVRVTAAAGAATPGGSVQILCDGAVVGAAPLTSGQATFSFTPTTGTHTIAADYSGDSQYQTATATLTLLVSKTPAAAGLTANVTAPVYGQPVTLNVQMAVPNGASVQFLDGTVTIGSAPATDGVAVLVAPPLAPGSHSLTAKWAGDASTAATITPPLVLSVQKAQTSTALAVAGTNVSAAVSAVAPAAGSPGGTVRFLNAETNASIGNIVVSAGAATLPLPSGVNVVTAVYSGDDNFLTSKFTEIVALEVAGAASYATQSFAPDELVTLFGPNLATTTLTPASAPVATLGGTTVMVTDSAGTKHAADLLYVSPSQVNFVMPSTAALGAASVTVTNGNKIAISTQIQVANVAPGLFTMNATGDGVPAGQILRFHAGGAQEPPQDLAVFDAASNAWLPVSIDLGSATDTVYLVLYGTGIRHRKGAPVCTVGGKQVSVAYAGAQGTYEGLDQINLVLPRSLKGAGVVDLTFAVDGAVSNAVTVAIQ
jgi:uncharacterized protein (TIGR03437 family)